MMANPVPAVKRDPTAAARAQRYRARKRLRALAIVTKRDAAPVTAHEAPIDARVTVMPPRRRVSWSAMVLVIIAFAIAALALVINGQTGWRFGTTPLAAVTFAGLALAADMLAIVLPAAAVTLWHAGRRGLAASAWTTWIVAASLATLCVAGASSRRTPETPPPDGRRPSAQRRRPRISGRLPSPPRSLRCHSREAAGGQSARGAAAMPRP